MIPEGLEPSLPGCRPGVVAAGPRDQLAEVGVEPTDIHQALDLAALPVCVLGPTLSPKGRGSEKELRRPDLNRRRTAYETVLETRLQSTPQR